MIEPNMLEGLLDVDREIEEKYQQRKMKVLNFVYNMGLQGQEPPRIDAQEEVHEHYKDGLSQYLLNNRVPFDDQSLAKISTFQGHRGLEAGRKGEEIIHTVIEKDEEIIYDRSGCDEFEAGHYAGLIVKEYQEQRYPLI
jgi:hypothetical protein